VELGSNVGEESVIKRWKRWSRTTSSIVLSVSVYGGGIVNNKMFIS